MKNQREDLVRNRYLDEYVDNFLLLTDELYIPQQIYAANIDKEVLETRVIAKGPILVRDSNQACKNYEKYFMTNQVVLFNLPSEKCVKTR